MPNGLALVEAGVCGRRQRADACRTLALTQQPVPSRRTSAGVSVRRSLRWVASHSFWAGVMNKFLTCLRSR